MICSAIIATLLLYIQLAILLHIYVIIISISMGVLLLVEELVGVVELDS